MKVSCATHQFVYSIFKTIYSVVGISVTFGTGICTESCFLNVNCPRGEGRNVYRVLVGKPEGKRPLERPRHRWENGIKMDLKEIGWGDVEWIQLAPG
jgi:hypothetical protein